MLDGRFNDGAVVSLTVTLNMPVVVTMLLSVAEQSTWVSPSEKVEPDEGTHVAVNRPSSASLAEAEYETAAPALLVASTVISAGRSRLGAVFVGVGAFTVNVKSALLLNRLPLTPPSRECVMR